MFLICSTISFQIQICLDLDLEFRDKKQMATKPKTKKSLIWAYYNYKDSDTTAAVCKKCNKQIGCKESSTKGLWSHLKSCDLTSWDKLKKAPSEVTPISAYLVKKNAIQVWCACALRKFLFLK
jgi:hypothetical protein